MPASRFDNVLTEASGLFVGLDPRGRRGARRKVNVRLKPIEFVRHEPERALVVMVGEDGQVRNPRRQSAARLPTHQRDEAGTPQRTHPR